MLRPMPIAPVPPETARVAHAAFPKGHKYLRLADELDAVFTDDAFLALLPRHGQPALPPWRLGRLPRGGKAGGEEFIREERVQLVGKA
jgi:transposase